MNFENYIKYQGFNFLFKKVEKPDNFILECFNNNHIINDIEKKDYNIFISSDIYLIIKDNIKLGFIKVYYKPSLDAYGFYTFLHPSTSFKEFKNIIISASYNLIACCYSNRKEPYNFYLDVASPVISKWVRQTTKRLDELYIYPEYIVCYVSLTKLEVQKILVEIE